MKKVILICAGFQVTLKTKGESTKGERESTRHVIARRKSPGGGVWPGNMWRGETWEVLRLLYLGQAVQEVGAQNRVERRPSRKVQQQKARGAVACLSCPVSLSSCGKHGGEGDPPSEGTGGVWYSRWLTGHGSQAIHG